MPNRRMEDKISAEDLMKKPQKELSVMIYMQALKTNSQVAENIKDIEDNKTCIKDLSTEMKSKIGWKVFTIGASVLGLIIIIFNILDVVKGI